ncbi:hypothetical protein DENSPDRAFT_519989 [Dentipellis sp. KUC8613]|nr:hypothetical protein DENSPDRAFT_519989 [Dentipellis sp. KUC8613]
MKLTSSTSFRSFRAICRKKVLLLGNLVSVGSQSKSCQCQWSLLHSVKISSEYCHGRSSCDLGAAFGPFSPLSWPLTVFPSFPSFLRRRRLKFL